jgi:hypothetical protein
LRVTFSVPDLFEGVWRSGWKEHGMNLDYAIDRLYDTGWSPSVEGDLEAGPDGRQFPSVKSIQDEFARQGLSLEIKHNLIFKCFRATWGPKGEKLDPARTADAKHGTVIGSCEREAAVFALAQHRAKKTPVTQMALA